jgi:cold shock protein
MRTGVCKFWNHAKGYGFLTGDDGNDYFIHISAVEKSGLQQLIKDQQVMFFTSEDRKTGRTKVDHVELVA